MRGGKEFNIFCRILLIIVKSKRLSRLVRWLIQVNKNQKQLRFIRFLLFALNRFATNNAGLYVDVKSSLNFVQITLVAISSSIGGLMISLFFKNSMIFCLIFFSALYLRGIEEAPSQYNSCQLLCQVAEEQTNQKIQIEMKKVDKIF